MTAERGASVPYWGRLTAGSQKPSSPAGGKAKQLLGGGEKKPFRYLDYLGTMWQAQIFILQLYSRSLPFQLSNQVPPKVPSFYCQEGHKLFLAKGYQPLYNLEGQCAPTTFETITGLKPQDSFFLS